MRDDAFGGCAARLGGCDVTRTGSVAFVIQPASPRD
jgi:hypothetical protein